MNQVVKPIPEWAVLELKLIQEMEIALGNIPGSDAWQTRDLSEIIEALNDREEDLDPHDVDHRFSKLVRKLAQAGFRPQEIADAANAYVGYKGGPKYCNAQEITEILEENPSGYLA